MELIRMAASRALRLAVFALSSMLAGVALANGPAVVVEADSGKVLHAERATDPWFPASITKLMTTYVALDLVRQGRASMDQLLTVSERAEALPPSKMAFKPGTQIRLDNALKIIMVKSANDVAATIAENLGGSIEGFADLMNDEAERLGMHESHFVNPHGLPDDRNQTSARDMATLARALLREFPNQEYLFHIGAIQFGRRVIRNHNGLIGRYPGADGMKTGFICAGGFNVVATATRNGRRLITVVLGSPSANERTLKAAELFDRGFVSRATFASPTLDALPASTLREPPNMRSVICDRRGPVPEEDDAASTTVSNQPGTPNLFSSNILAFAGAGPDDFQRTPLAPRSPAVQPIRVWVGLNPPTEAELAAQAAEEEAAEAARKSKVKSVKASKKAAGRKTALPSGAIENGKDKKGRASLTLKPVSGADITKDTAGSKAASKKSAKTN
jgi:D-alanyl-D-alanine carboxypeptidase